MTFGYYTTVVGKFNSRVVTIYINAYAWVGFYLPDSRNRYPIVIRSFNQDPETAYSRADVTLSTVSYISSNRSNTDFTANFSNVSDYKNLSSLTRIDTGEVVTFNASRTDKWPNLQINEFAYLSNLNDVLHLSGGTMTGSIEFDGGTDVDDILDYIKISIPGD